MRISASRENPVCPSESGTYSFTFAQLIQPHRHSKRTAKVWPFSHHRRTRGGLTGAFTVLPDPQRPLSISVGARRAGTPGDPDLSYSNYQATWRNGRPQPPLAIIQDPIFTVEANSPGKPGEPAGLPASSPGIPTGTFPPG